MYVCYICSYVHGPPAGKNSCLEVKFINQIKSIPVAIGGSGGYVAMVDQERSCN